MPELHREGIVQPELLPQPRDRCLVGALTDHRLHRITRRDIEQQEGDDEYAKQRGDREQQPTDDERGHGAAFAAWAMLTPVHGWPLKMMGGTNPFTQGWTA